MASSLCVALCGLSLASPVLAHPHVFVDARAGFILDEAGRLTSLKITWTYDAFTSLTLFDILDLDKDNDGVLDDADRAAIVAGETKWQDDYKGDTYLEQNGRDVALAKPLNGLASMTDDRITVSFDLPLQAPIAVEDGVVLKLYDPNYYYSYTVVGLDEVEGAPCTSALDAFVADEASAELQSKLALLSREETPEIENVGRLFADQVRLTCD
ncbi:MAG: DUF1007 family protein [Paracoccaceae bacterium]